MLTPGTVLGDRYEIIEKIGAGGMSIVYKAKCHRLQRFVAIKVLREEFVADEEFVAKFRKEALAAASLSHPNIVGIYDVGSDLDLHYIVMEYIEGRTLKDMIAKEGPFDSKMVLEFGVQMASALRHAHRKKIIHRDIKPQNILVTHDNVLKVTDFGIAKAVDSSTVVATGNAIGSVHYFSPEQAKGKYVNETSDLYSCGIVLFELATKKLPFEADSHISIALKHINEDLPKPSTINPEVMPSLEKLILKATHKSQSARYQDADEMLKDMKGIMTDPNYIIEDNSISDQTILLTDIETEYIRNNGNKSLKGVQSKNPNNYTEMPELEPKEDEGEISTLYKVLVSIGGVLASLLIISLITAAVFLWLPSMGRSKDVIVPNLIGKTEAQAEEFLKSYKLKLNVVGEEPSEDIPVGTIMRQTPGENSRVKPNSVIEVVLAQEAIVQEEEIKMPDLIGLDRITAERQLIEQGLVLGSIESIYDDTIEIGKIVDQVPAAGESVDLDTKITLIISKGPQIVMANVPNLVNLSVRDAEISLSNEKLRLGAQKEEFSDTVPAGLIINQSVGVNRQVEQGSKIDVVVSKGKQEVVPEPEPSAPEVPAQPETPTLVTKNFTLRNYPSELEGKDTFHVMMKLVTEDGISIAFDGQVNKDQFPLTVSVRGRGVGILETHFDGRSYFQDPIEF